MELNTNKYSLLCEHLSANKDAAGTCQYPSYFGDLAEGTSIIVAKPFIIL